jgi:small subunit ribosomal protein S5
MFRPEQNKEFEEKIIQINRVAKKTKGGNQIGFSILMVVGDKKGRVGVGLGKAADVMTGIKKAVRRAKKNMFKINLKGTTIAHDIRVKFGAAEIMFKPAPAGSGIIAGGAVRSVMEAAGVNDVSSKVLGTKNQATNVYCTIKALKLLQ